MAGDYSYWCMGLGKYSLMCVCAWLDLMYACIRSCVCMDGFNVCMYAYVCIYIYIYMCVCVSTCVYIYMCGMLVSEKSACVMSSMFGTLVSEASAVFCCL